MYNPSTLRSLSKSLLHHRLDSEKKNQLVLNPSLSNSFELFTDTESRRPFCFNSFVMFFGRRTISSGMLMYVDDWVNIRTPHNVITFNNDYCHECKFTLENLWKEINIVLSSRGEDEGPPQVIFTLLRPFVHEKYTANISRRRHEDGREV